MCRQEPTHHFRPARQNSDLKVLSILPKLTDNFRQEIDGDIGIGRNDETADTLVTNLLRALRR
jgi:hypothetical protein